MTGKVFRYFLYGLFSLIGIALLPVLVFWLTLQLSDTSNGRLVSSGENREYLLYVPQSYNPESPVPLVVSIHGFSDWPAHHSRMTGWNKIAEEEGLIVVYPSGTGYPKRWRMPQYDGNEEGTMKDVLFISDLIDELQLKYNIDPSRVFVNGLSNGGGMSYVAGCFLSNRIAAVGGVAGYYNFPLENCTPERALPTIAFHGTADPIVSYYGNRTDTSDYTSPNVAEWIRSLAQLNGCSLEPAQLEAPELVSGIWYSGCNGNADVKFYTIEGGGHTWPGGKPLPKWITGITYKDLPATRLIWEFYQQHPLPAQ